jgi:hypothetical protein
MLINGQFDLGTGVGVKVKEFVALPSNTDVASFTDTDLSDTTASFTATIDWGDGSTTNNATIVAGASGSFTVEGGHTYTDENQYPALVTVTPTAGGSPLFIAGTVPVADTDSFTVQGTTITFTPNQPLTNVTVATFTDSNTSNPATDFTAQIDWGDGSPATTGTVQGSAGSFSIVGSHTYTAAGENTVSVSFADDAADDAASGFVASTAVSGFGGTVTLNSATEGTALNNVQVATFADTSAGTHIYTANINWGDGSSSAGTVSGSGPSFTVTGSHTYTDEEGDEVLGGSPDVVVSIVRDGSVTITPSGTVAVADADVLTMTTKTIGGSSGQALTGVTVATFTDTNTSNIASDLIANIDWGDGSTVDVGSVSGSAGSFTVTGSHTYTADGQYNVNVTIIDDLPLPGQIGTVISTADIGLSPGDFLLNSTVEGSASQVNVATFTDGTPGDTTSSFTASIDWGDGHTTAGSVSGGSGSFTVSGSNAYADEGDDAVSVTLTRNSDHHTSTVTGTATVGEGDGLSLTADNFGANPGIAVTNIPVATFTDTFMGQVASDLAATINWGDGSTSVGTVSGGSGFFTVTGSHTYSNGGNYTFNVSVADDAPGTANVNANGMAGVNFNGQMVLTHATEGTALPNSTTVATFSDANGGDTPSSFTASISWGDGLTTPGTVSGGAGTFTVSGGHTYGDEGTDTATVILTHTADQAASTVSGNVTVAEADALTPHGTTFTANAHQAFSGTVATFDDTGFPNNVPGDFTAAIDWGDGQTTAGTVSGGSGSAFTVTGAHTYAAGGQDVVKVKLADDAPGTANVTATTSASVRSLTGQMALASATEASALPGSTPIATFNDTIPSDQAGDFTATITWGDGATTAGTVVGSGGTFTVEGGHTYADEGSNSASVTLTHTADQLQATASGTVSVAEGDVLAGQGMSFTANAHQAFSGAVATFSDTDTANVAGDFAALIDWGDGQTTTGTVSGGNGSFTVAGSHTYAAAGQDTVKVTLADDAPGTASATATATATVNQVISNPFDFNGDAISDLVFQNEAFNAGSAAGQPQIWLWNGTAVTSQATYTNPGLSTWHIITSRDVNGDGKADLIWQNADGTPGIWLLNGTTPLAEVALSNPGSTWHIVASGDTNADGKADLIWQNTDGTLGVWLMNGTTPALAAAIGNPGTNWKVVGAADYNSDGRDDILLQDTNTGNLMVDIMNGTTVSSTATITVGDPSWHAISTGEFNGQAEIAWQNNNSQLGIWLMNGTTPVAKAGLANPGAGWQLISIDHFTPNGQADLLLQNTNAAMMLWEMNGTTVATQLNLPNPGAGMQSENGHPLTATATTTSAATAFNAADLGSGGLHLSAPDSSVAGGSSSQSNLLHAAYAGG